MTSTMPSHDDAPLLPAFEGASIWAVLEKPPATPRYPLRREGPPPEVPLAGSRRDRVRRGPAGPITDEQEVTT